MTFWARQYGWLRAVPALLFFAQVGGGLRSLTPSVNSRPFRRMALHSLIPAAEPADDQDTDLQPARAVGAAARWRRSATAIRPAWIVLAASPEVARPRIIHRLKIPPPGGDTVPPY